MIHEIPVCPKCRRLLRKCVPIPSKEYRLSSINNRGDGMVPWNYLWDGKCENCGYDFNIVMRIDMGSTGPDNRIRETEVRAGEKGFLHHITCDYGLWRETVLSGVKIETHCGYGSSEKVFLSANELKYLIKTLEDSPILRQYDYYKEGTLDL